LKRKDTQEERQNGMVKAGGGARGGKRARARKDLDGALTGRNPVRKRHRKTGKGRVDGGNCCMYPSGLREPGGRRWWKEQRKKLAVWRLDQAKELSPLVPKKMAT